MSRQWVLLLLFARGPPSTELCRVAGQGISQKQQTGLVTFGRRGFCR
jgi:hypothetical protein